MKTEDLKKELEDFLSQLPRTQQNPDAAASLPQPTIGLQRVLQRAIIQTQSAGRNLVHIGHILVALLDEEQSTAVYLLNRHGLTRFGLIDYLSHGPREGSEIEGTPQDPAQAAGKSALALFTVHLNKKAAENHIDPLVGRQDIIERVIQILCRRNKNNPVLVGDPGVGKTAIAEGLALRIVKGEVPEPIKNFQIYSLDMGSLLAGTRFRGDFEERVKNILKEIEGKKETVLFVDEIHTLVGSGGSAAGAMDASNLLKPALARGNLSCIGSTTHKDYRQIFEKDSALSRRFQRVDVQEPSIPETIEILKGLKPKYEEHHGVTYTDEALAAATELSSRYITNRFLPDKAIDVVDEAGARARLKKLAPPVIISDKEIEETVSQIARVPVKNVTSNDREKLKSLEHYLKLLIYGQNDAVNSLVTAIKVARSGLGRKNKPMGAFLFAGPTGVGKTELAKQLANLLGVNFLRFDMSEYMEKHAVSRLVGAPPGYVGYDEGGLLTESIVKNPHSVLLLDEIEKAHPDLISIILQVADNAVLTDTNGRTADLQTVTLIMTTNAGARDNAKSELGFVPSQKDTRSVEAIKRGFLPEFLNRLDAIIQFNALGESELLKVIDKFIMELQEQLRAKNVDLTSTPDVSSWIFKKAYDPSFGARPMARAVDQNLKKPLVDELLFGKLAKGGKVKISVAKDELRFDFDEPERVSRKQTSQAGSS